MNNEKIIPHKVVSIDALRDAIMRDIDKYVEFKIQAFIDGVKTAEYLSTNELDAQETEHSDSQEEDQEGLTGLTI